MKRFKKWLKAKQKADKAIALERSLRKSFGDSALTEEKNRDNFIEGNLKVVIQRNIGYSIPSANITRLQKRLSEETFNDLFRKHFSLREGVYKALGKKEKKIVDKLIKVYEAPYQIVTTER